MRKTQPFSHPEIYCSTMLGFFTVYVFWVHLMTLLFVLFQTCLYLVWLCPQCGVQRVSGRSDCNILGRKL